MSDPDDAHSARYLTAVRDHWHSRAQLARCAADWGFAAARDVLDLGCGQGHWSCALAPHLPALRRLVGVDREARWVREVVEAWRGAAIDATLDSLQGDAARLPFADQSFDLVTCQTLLIHVPDPVAVLCEARRLLRPGGRLLLSEPNNLAGTLATFALDTELPIAQLLQVAAFHLRCQRGKVALGLGDINYGERLTDAIARARLSFLGSVQVERVDPLTPPYLRESEREALAGARAALEQGVTMWPREEAQRYYTAYDGPDDFDAAYDAVLAYERDVLQRAERGQWVIGGGTVHYLACAARA